MTKRRAGRKGIGIVLLLTVLAVGGMLFYDAAREAAVPTVQTAVLTRQTVTETVICAGTVTAGDGIEVYVPMPCVAGEIAVEVGDKVKQGEVLLTVDRAATLALAVGAGLSEQQSVMASAALPQTVTAPSDGVVSAVGAVQGGTLDTASPCVMLSEGDGIEIAVAVKESLLPRIAVGQEVTVSGVAFEKEAYKGTVSRLASSARSRVNGTASETVVDAVVTLLPGEADESLLIGLSAKTSVTVGRRENVLLVPYECLTQDEDGNGVVYRVTNGIAERVTVTVCEELAQGVTVEGGLSDGDVLAVEPEALDGERLSVRTEATA